MPQRVQMSRQRPWRAKHPKAVICDRRTIYGNPYRVVKETLGWAVVDLDGERWAHGIIREQDAIRHAIELFEKYRLPTIDLGPLRGLDLACWCGPGDSCHVEPLLAAANREGS